MEVLGGFFGVQKINVLQKLLSEIEKLHSAFILISTGSSFNKISNICDNITCIKHIIIFCMDTEKYKSSYSSNKRVELISKDIIEINNFLNEKSSNYPDYDKNIKKLINHTPLISFYEYENYYYIYHKMLSFFFKENFSYLIFSEGYKKKVFSYIEKNTEFDENKKAELKNIIESLKNSNNFLKQSLSFYTSESQFVYTFNKTMRNIEKGLTRLSFLIGPMYYSMVRFLKNNKNYGLNKTITLYRKIAINQYELNIYEMSINEIICFPSFSSTSLNKNFVPTHNASKVNSINEQEKIYLLMILHYNHLPNNNSQGMFIKEFSEFKHEEEILLFPFTFIRVNNINKVNSKLYELDCDIINKNCVLEFGLKQNQKVKLNNNELTIEKK